MEEKHLNVVLNSNASSQKELNCSVTLDRRVREAGGGEVRNDSYECKLLKEGKIKRRKQRVNPLHVLVT